MSEPFQPVRIAFQIDDAYLLEAMRHDPSRNSPKSRRKVYMQMAAVVLTMAIYSLLERSRHEDLWWMPVPIAVVLVLFWLYLSTPKGRLKFIRRAYRKSMGEFPVERRIEFGPDGFKVVGSSGATSFQPWQSVTSVVELSEGLAIYLPGGACEWIPKRFFPDSESYQRVINDIAAKVGGFERMP